MKDNETGRLDEVDFRTVQETMAVTVEGIMRSPRRDRPLMAGLLLAGMVETAQRLVPDFAPLERRHPLTHPPIEIKGQGLAVPADRRPRWLRIRQDSESQSLVEYALILALVSIVAISVLMVIGANLTALLSRIGASI